MIKGANFVKETILRWKYCGDSPRNSPIDINDARCRALLQDEPKDEINEKRNAGKYPGKRKYPAKRLYIPVEPVRQASAYATDHLVVRTSIQITHV